MTKQKTAAIYARFSSDLQNDRSIDDQFSLCRIYAGREGFTVTREFADRAKTSATLFDRDGFLELMHEAKARKFDAVIVESLDRISRDPEDLSGIHKRLKYAQIDIHTLNEGIADDMKIGFRSMMGAAFLKDLAAKVRRHHVGRAREGDQMGMACYGYRAVPGKPGKREIHPAEADIVRRIFREYGDGVSPRAIATGLTADRVPAPSGADVWSHQSFLGGGGKGGMLRNRLYIGELIYNRSHSVRNPDSGAVTARLNPETDHIRRTVPHLRIVDQDLWDAAQAIRASRAAIRAGKATSAHRRDAARPVHLLSGLLRCGACNGHMIFSSTSRGRQFVACASAKTKSSCSHTKSYDVDLLKQLVVKNFRENLIDPRRHAEAMKAAHAEYAALAKKHSTEKIAAERQISRLTVQITRLVDAIENSDRPVRELMASLEAKEAERVGLVERVRLLGASNVVTLHPHVIDAYRANIEKLHAALTVDAIDPGIVTAFRNLMDSIVVQPTGYRQPYVVDAYGRLSAIMGVNLFPTARSGEEIVAEEGVKVCCESGKPNRSSATRQHLPTSPPRYGQPFFSWPRMRSKVSPSRMESAMRIMGAASLVAVCGMLACAPARADWVPPFRGNDTGGIIAFPMASQMDVRQLAVDHCASYGKVVKFLAVDPQYGGYISFACRWVPYGANDRPLVTRY